jgi:tetratricopeptide (TPR) repeat protein
MKNFFKIILFLVLGLISFLLVAQDKLDERTTLMKQANHFTIRRNYEKANSIYKKLLEENQGDYVVATKLIQNYFKTSQIDEAEEMIEKYREIFPKLTLLRLNTVLRIRRDKSEDAYDKVQEYLNSHAKNMNRYRELALLFQSNKEYNYAVQILEQAREIAGDEFLNARLLASNYQYLGEYEKAILEYVRYLRKNRSYRYFVYSRIKNMLEQDATLVEVLREENKRYDNQDIGELYAKSLAFVEEYKQALSIYASLDVNLLRVFAEGQFKKGNYGIASQALQKYVQRANSTIKIADAKLMLAEIFLARNELQKAEEVLLQIYNNKQLQNRRNFYRSHANRRCREKLAEIAMQKKEDPLKYYDEARQFAMNNQEKLILDLKITDYLIMKSDFSAASQKLKQIKTQTEIGTEVDKLSNYYDFLLAFMQNEPAADSLLTEVMINIPQDNKVNNVLLLKEIVKDESSENKNTILSAFRRKNIYNYDEAMHILDSLRMDNEIESVKILQGLWAIENNDPLAQDYFEGEFTKPILQTIASYFNAVLEKDGQIRSLMASEFLKNNSEAVFAPQFREILR